MPQSNSVHAQTDRATPDRQDLNKFAHRVPVMDAASDALNRAIAIADLLEVCTEVADMCSFQPETVWRVAQAIRFEILDAQALLEVRS